MYWMVVENEFPLLFNPSHHYVCVYAIFQCPSPEKKRYEKCKLSSKIYYYLLFIFIKFGEVAVLEWDFLLIREARIDGNRKAIFNSFH